MNNLKLIAVFVTTLFCSCEKDSPVIPNEEELITTVIYKLTPSDGSTLVSIKFSDLDGDGGKAPIITTGTLKKNVTYAGSIEVLNESVNPVINIGSEVLEEADDHQFFYGLSTKNISVTYTDKDSKGNPLGLKTTLKTGVAEIGTLKITLKHKPNKTATGVSNGIIDNAGGETDIEVNFPVSVL